jgi:hypothetical protein
LALRTQISIISRKHGFFSSLLVMISAAAVAAPLPPHPRLLLDAQDISALRQRITQQPWTERWSAYKKAVDRMLSQPVDLPPRGGNWSHNYVCPQHGARLKQGKRIGTWEWEHHCPVGNHILRGDTREAHLDFDGNAIMGVHSDYAQLLRDAGVVYQVTGDRDYADKGREILLAYIAQYLSYGRHDNQGRAEGGGRVASQSLTEASWLVILAQGADLIWDTLTADQRRAAEERLFRPAIHEVILPCQGYIRNIRNAQCHLNAAIGLVGYLFGNEDLIRIAIDDPQCGFRQQIKQGVRDDGMWFEGASSYHFFTIIGLWPLAEAARHCGLNLYDERFKSMFDSPLALAMPNLVLPNFNDSVTVPLMSHADQYELAYARWRDPRYVAMLTAGRGGNLALWFGVPELPTGGLNIALGSRNSPASGYAILERGLGDQATWLCVKYGPHGGGHGHNDKNHFILYTRGRIVMPDADKHAYSSPLYKSWDKTSLAHNTVVVDEKSQARAEGHCLAFGATNGVDYAITDAGDIYEGLHFVRTAALLDENLVVIVDNVRADREHLLDMVCHFRGKWQSLPDGKPWTPPDARGYKHIANGTTRTTSAPVTIAADVALTLAGGEPTEIITGTGVGTSTEDRVPLVLFRRKAKETTYVWAVSLDNAPVTLDTGADVTVRTADQRWDLDINLEQPSFSVKSTPTPRKANQ